jgi:ABC-type transport system involved in multi-copper enzyme maturation permease subunit
MNGTDVSHISADHVSEEGTTVKTIARMTAAELLKLYRRRALMAWSVALFVGGQILFYGLGAIQHAADPVHHAPAGGPRGLANAMMLVSYLGGVAAVMIGTAAGGGDTASGVFRDLASTGRSRIALFAVRVPGALIVTGVLAVVSFAITATGAVVFAGASAPSNSGPAPSAAVLAQCGLAVAVTIGLTTVLAVGLSSLLSSRSITIGLLLCWNLALVRVLEHATSLGSLRQALSLAAEDRLVPVSVGGAYVVPISGWTAAVVLVVWAAVALVAGAWQTARRDA